jgi:hypothetical protein
MLLNYDAAVAVFHAAGLTDLDVGWLRSQADNGRIPSTVVARKRRFLLTELEKVIAKYTADAVHSKYIAQAQVRRRPIRKTRFNT